MYHKVHSKVMILSKPLIQQSYKETQVNSYNLITAYHPNNTKRGCVCICYKLSVGVPEVKLLSLCQCIIFAVSLQNYKGYILVLSIGP